MATQYPDPQAVARQAESIHLARESAMLTELVAELTPYTGELPETMEQYRALPEAHRRQLAREDPRHVMALAQVEELLDRSAEHDRQQERRRAELAGLPVDSPEAFAALDERQRAELAMTLTSRQRLALCGQPPQENEAYL
jgi:hypothetical protein